MSYPVYSTSVETAAIKRVNRVMQRSKWAKKIANGEVFNCRKIVGTNDYSQHAWGNAVDLFPRNTSLASLHDLANNLVLQTTKVTIANRGRKLAVSQVIDHDNRRIWTPSEGWHTYTGTTGAHVHVSGSPLRTGIPPCAS